MSVNKTSQKYEGVRSKELKGGDVAYYVRYYDTKGERKELKVGTKNGGWSEKKAHLKRIELLNTPIQSPKINISEVIDRYLKIQELHLSRHKTFINYKGQCIKHIKPFFGAYTLESINVKTISDFMLTLKDTKSNKTINNIIERLGAIIDFAIKEYQLSIKNPIKDIKKLRLDNARERFLTKDEVESLLKVAKTNQNKEIYLFFVLAFSTGARLNSVRNIKRSHIDFEKGVIQMQDFKNNSKYNAFLTPLAKEVLKDYTNDILFTTPERTITRNMQKILNDLFNKNIDLHDRKQRVVIHTTRHTFASHLAIKGTPIHIIQKLLNHKDIKMTMRYAHLLPSSGKEYVENLWG